MRIIYSRLQLAPGQTALVTGDYGTGKTTFVKWWTQTVGRGCYWSAPTRPGAPPDYADVARVVRSAPEMERAAKDAAFVVWPSPPSSIGQEARLDAFNEYCRVAMKLARAVVVCDENLGEELRYLRRGIVNRLVWAIVILALALGGKDVLQAAL